MMQSSMYSETPHPIVRSKSYDFKRRVTCVTRTERPVKYYFTDFGISCRLPENVTDPRETPIMGGDRSVPEHQRPIGPQNPYRTDVYCLGNLFRTQFLQVCNPPTYVRRRLGTHFHYRSRNTPVWNFSTSSSATWSRTTHRRVRLSQKLVSVSRLTSGRPRQAVYVPASFHRENTLSPGSSERVDTSFELRNLSRQADLLSHRPNLPCDASLPLAGLNLLRAHLRRPVLLRPNLLRPNLRRAKSVQLLLPLLHPRQRPNRPPLPNQTRRVDPRNISMRRHFTGIFLQSRYDYLLSRAHSFITHNA